MKTAIHCGSSALFGGLLLGLAEGTLVYLSSSDPMAGRVFPYAAALYGLTGLVFGVLLGIPISMSRRVLLRPTLEGARAFSFTFFLWGGASTSAGSASSGISSKRGPATSAGSRR